MKKNIRQQFIEIYKPLVIDFVNNISNIKYDKIPEPFIPAYGKLYETSKTRIAFIGMETRGYGNISNFVKNVEENPETAIFRIFEEFDDLEFCNWGNNFGNSFWDFNFKFLAYFYNINDWKKIKNGEEENILRSFAWGNTNAIERFHISAEKEHVDYLTWQKVKHASKCFDNGNNIINSLHPHIMIILNWDINEEWLLNGINEYIEPEILDDHFWYFFMPKSKTHVLWTAHPRWLSKNRDFDKYIIFLVDFLKQRML